MTSPSSHGLVVRDWPRQPARAPTATRPPGAGRVAGRRWSAPPAPGEHTGGSGEQEHDTPATHGSAPPPSSDDDAGTSGVCLLGGAAAGDHTVVGCGRVPLRPTLGPGCRRLSARAAARCSARRSARRSARSSARRSAAASARFAASTAADGDPVGSPPWPSARSSSARWHPGAFVGCGFGVGALVGSGAEPTLGAAPGSSGGHCPGTGTRSTRPRVRRGSSPRSGVGPASPSCRRTRRAPSRRPAGGVSAQFSFDGSGSPLIRHTNGCPLT